MLNLLLWVLFGAAFGWWRASKATARSFERAQQTVADGEDKNASRLAAANVRGYRQGVLLFSAAIWGLVGAAIWGAATLLVYLLG